MGFVSIRFVGGVLPSYSHLFLYSLAIFILMAFSFTGEYDDVSSKTQWCRGQEIVGWYGVRGNDNV